ncbi:MAG: SDR family oxidoreductase, partial [Myxococcota bacterium]
MSDLLVELGGRRSTRQLIKTLGLPIPLPQRLRRLSTPWEERPLHDRNVVVWSHGELTDALASSLGAAGANPFVDGDLQPYTIHGEAWARPPAEATADEPSRPHALIFDGTALRDVDDLRKAYDFFHARIKSLGTCGRLVVLARQPSKMKTPSAAAAQRALEGFVRSCGKEVGRKGATANLVVVESGAEDRLDWVLRFLLSDRSAYISGQPIFVSKKVKMTGDLQFVRPLQGKTALVTGAARGIGASIARSLAREGAHVLCLDRPADDGPLSEIVAEVGGTAVLVDVTDSEAAKIIAAAAEPHGGIDIVIHNAGVTRDKTLGRMDESLW